VIDLLGQQHHPLFGLLAGGDVHQHVDGADQFAGIVAQRRRIGHEADARAVRPFSDRFHVPDRAILLECNRHRTIFMGQRRAVRQEQLPGHAPHVADFRRPSGEFDAAAVEERDPSLRIGRVDGGGQRLQQVAELLFVGFGVVRGTRCDGGVFGEDPFEIGLIRMPEQIQHYPPCHQMPHRWQWSLIRHKGKGSCGFVATG